MGSCSCSEDILPEEAYIPENNFLSDSTSLLLKRQSLAFSDAKFDQNYDTKETIGSGGYGKCMKVVDKITQNEFCAKYFRRFKKMIWKEDQIKKEIEIMKKLDHPNICKFHDYYFENNFIYIIIELLSGGDLLDENYNHLTNNSEKSISNIMRQILSGVYYLHLKNICHRDIKTENILYKSENSEIVKIIDFGSAIEFSPNQFFSEKAGTAYYVAPEVLIGHYNEKCDIWSCGIVLNILLTGIPPYTGDNEEDIQENIRKGGYDVFTNPKLNNISLPAKELLDKMLKPDPSLRLSAFECINHEWIKGCNEEHNLSTCIEASKIMTNYKQKNLIEVLATKYLITHLTLDEEMNEATNLFQEIDTDKSGTITKEELLLFLKRVYPNKNKAEQDVENIFKEVDIDGSGTIEFSEFVTMYIKGKQLISEEMILKAFQALDVNKTGQISVNSILKVFKHNKKLSESTCKSIIDDIDSNKDQIIDFNEFTSLMRNTVKTSKTKLPRKFSNVGKK